MNRWLRRFPVLWIALGWALLVVLGRLLVVHLEDGSSFERSREGMRAAEKLVEPALRLLGDAPERYGLDVETTSATVGAVARARDRIRETGDSAIADSDLHVAEACRMAMRKLALAVVQANLLLTAGNDRIPSLVTTWAQNLEADLRTKEGLRAVYARGGSPVLPRIGTPAEIGSVVAEATALHGAGIDRISAGDAPSGVAALLRAQALEAETACRLAHVSDLYGLPVIGEPAGERRG